MRPGRPDQSDQSDQLPWGSDVDDQHPRQANHDNIPSRFDVDLDEDWADFGWSTTAHAATTSETPRRDRSNRAAEGPDDHESYERQDDYAAHDYPRRNYDPNDYYGNTQRNQPRSRQQQYQPQIGQPPRFRRRYDPATYEPPADNALGNLVRSVGEWTFMLAGVAVVSILIRVFFLQMFDIPSGSMLQTIQLGDKVIVNKLAYKFSSPGRGNVVVFNSPPAELEQDPSAPILIKRIVGLPGETVAAVDGKITIDGKLLDEPYIFPGDITEDFDPVELGPDQYFMMGDHREDSSDSRFFGPIEKDAFKGRTMFIVWPVWHFKIFW